MNPKSCKSEGKLNPMFKYLSVLTCLILCLSSALAAENCSRIAIVNYQQVLVDTSSSAKGEGLRYFLERDPIAKKYLDEYQYRSRPSWQSAAMGTFGAVMLLSGILRSGNGENETLTNKDTLMFGGLLFMGVGYLISRTNQYNNETWLTRSVDEYNKRNSPKIFLSTGFDESQSGSLNVIKEY
jgi:hypothetical protein